MRPKDLFHADFILSISNRYLNTYIHVFKFTRLITKFQGFRIYFCISEELN